MEDEQETQEVLEEDENLVNRTFISVEDKRVPSSMRKYTVGQVFETREQLSRIGIHPPFMSGIHPAGREVPAQSIVISGGYEDDVDEGNKIVYTGQGGQQAGSNVQIADQKMERGNLTLKLACTRGLPIHVTRGFKCHSAYAPPSGYRYDGLYIIERYWQETGKHGFKVWRYQMRRLEGQDPLPDPVAVPAKFKPRAPRTPKEKPEKPKVASDKKRKRKSRKSKEEESDQEENTDTKESAPSGPESSCQETCGYCGSFDFMTNGIHKCIDHLEKHKSGWIKQVSQPITKGNYQFETSDALTDLTQRFYLNQMRVRAAIEEEETVTAEGFMYQDELFLDQALSNLLWNTPENEQVPPSPSFLVDPPSILQVYSAWNNNNKEKETEAVN